MLWPFSIAQPGIAMQLEHMFRLITWSTHAAAQGPPGTGKTATILGIASVLLAKPLPEPAPQPAADSTGEGHHAPSSSRLKLAKSHE